MLFLQAGALGSATVNQGGTGYFGGQIINVGLGTGVTVKTVIVVAGHVFSVSVNTGGLGVHKATNVPTTGGTGHGLTLNLVPVSSVGFDPAPGSGNIQQHNRQGQIIRRRTIQHTHTANQKYHGTNLQSFPQATLGMLNRLQLARIAENWQTLLTSADRITWDNMAATFGAPWNGRAPGSLNGFEEYMSLLTSGYLAEPGGIPFNFGGHGNYATPADWSFGQTFFAFTGAPIPESDPAYTYSLPHPTAGIWTGATSTNSAGAQNHVNFLYLTNPYTSYYNPTKNPLIFVYAWYNVPPADTTDISLALTRVIGQAKVGAKIKVGMRKYTNATNATLSKLISTEVTIT